jgi:hypothetical protein
MVIVWLLGLTRPEEPNIHHGTEMARAVNTCMSSRMIASRLSASGTPWSSLWYVHPAAEGRRAGLITQFEYGIRQGLPRLIKLFRQFGWQWTTWACARSFEVTGAYPKLLVADGHEVGVPTLLDQLRQ